MRIHIFITFKARIIKLIHRYDKSIIPAYLKIEWQFGNWICGSNLKTNFENKITSTDVNFHDWIVRKWWNAFFFKLTFLFLEFLKINFNSPPKKIFSTESFISWFWKIIKKDSFYIFFLIQKASLHRLIQHKKNLKILNKHLIFLSAFIQKFWTLSYVTILLEICVRWGKKNFGMKRWKVIILT